MTNLLDWLLRLGAGGGTRNAARSLAERRHAARIADAVADRVPGPGRRTRPAA